MAKRTDRGYRFLEHTSDAYIEAWAPTLEAAFVESARGFYDTMLDIDKVRPEKEELVQVSGHDDKELLFNWLETLLLRFDIDGMAYSGLRISPISTKNRPLKFRAKIKGEKYSREKHGSKVEIKGVTYHLMTIQRRANRVTIRFILDL
ncbi:MAG TPA: archease [Candidatus Dormibacteraeota bacterium]|nr:archease [Candidatus Dormibacteraeota bacterium]